MPVLDPKALVEERVNAIREFHEEVGTDKAEIDVSGGVDSAVILGLLAKALGPANITAVHSQINSDPVALARAMEVADVFGVPLIKVDLSGIYADLVAHMTMALQVAGKAFDIDSNPAVLGSLRSCLRAPLGRGFNRMTGGGIRHGTGNECEDRWARFYQKGGDGEVDTNPIAMLSKGEVYQLALALGVPKSIITAVPTPDLWGKGEEHNDESEYADYLGIDPKGHTFYSYIDPETGEYTKVGLIERVSRWLDENTFDDPSKGQPSVEEILGSVLDDHPNPLRRNENRLFSKNASIPCHMAHWASSPAFRGVETELIGDLLDAARRVDARTWHKFNPNCPALGSREKLVQAGILTDELPDV